VAKIELTVLAMSLKKLIQLDEMESVNEILDTILRDARSIAADYANRDRDNY